jgi:hypothetical protein
VSIRTFPNIKELKRKVRRLGVEMRSSQPEVRKPEFLVALHERLGDIMTPEVLHFCAGEYSWPIAQRAMKDLEAEAEGLVEDRQMVLPGSWAHIPVPKALPIKINGVEKTVTAVYAGIPEGDAYTDSLQGNAEACFKKLTAWLEVWTPARKVIVEHPSFDFGRALEYLGEQEGDIRPATAVETDEDDD